MSAPWPSCEKKWRTAGTSVNLVRAAALMAILVAFAAGTRADPSVSVDTDPIYVYEGDSSYNTGSATPDAYPLHSISASIGDVQFTGPDTWEWSLGTGFDGPSTTSVTITVSDIEGYSGSSTFSIEVLNIVPDLLASTNQYARVGQAQSFQLGTFGDAATDSPWTVTVNWGDGGTNEAFFPAAPGGITSPAHTYATTGVFLVSFTVNDGDPGGIAAGDFYITATEAPEIAVEQPAGSNRVDGAATIDFTTLHTNGWIERTFVVRNTGGDVLHLTGPTIDGPNATNFTVVVAPAASVPASTGRTTMVVRFTPGTTGDYTAALHLGNDDGDEAPFDITLTGARRDAPAFPALAQQLYAKASNTGANDFFGTAVALSGNTLVVGANGEDSAAPGVNGDGADNSEPDAGAAYVYLRSGTNWTPQAYLKAGDPGNNDRFGEAVAIDGNTIAIGAPGESSGSTGVNGDEFDDSAFSSGAVYVFVRTGTNWERQAYIKASNAEVLDRFGASVALSGDTLVVGAFDEDSAAAGVNGDGANNSRPGSGAAYVFVRQGTNWSQQAYLKADAPDADDAFGLDVAVDGNTAVIGAYGDDSAATGVNGSVTNNGALDAGAAWVFVRSGTNWTREAFLKAHNTESNDFFGVSVAVRGNLAAVGAQAEDSHAIGINGDGSRNLSVQSGAVYVFARDGTNWTHQDYLKAGNTGGDDLFGVSVALGSDLLVVGAVGEDSAATTVNGDGSNNTATNAGAAYVYVREGGAWVQHAYLKAGNAGAFDNLGNRVAVSGNSVAVGAYVEDGGATGVNGDGSDNSAPNAGAAFVFAFSAGAEIAVEHPAGSNLVSGVSTVSCGSTNVGLPTPAVTLLITNAGTTNLNLGTITVEGVHSADFTVTQPATNDLAPGAFVAFTVTFTPGGVGTRTATLHIPSNDDDESLFDVELTGYGTGSLLEWRLQFFGVTNNAGIAANGADPNGNGVPNLAEFVLGTDPTRSGAPGVPTPVLTESHLSIGFTTAASLGGVTCGAESSTTLQADDWWPVPDTGTPPAHHFSVPRGTNRTLFLRLIFTEP